MEVWSYSEEPLGSWMCGELVSGNGRYYTVKCQSNDWKGSERLLGRVARHSLRPAPPVLNIMKWAHGDIVEVLCDVSWKLASVMENIDKYYYLVKFMGYSHESKAHKLDIRARLVWQDEKWVVFGKVCLLFPVISDHAVFISKLFLYSSLDVLLISYNHDQ